MQVETKVTLALLVLTLSSAAASNSSTPDEAFHEGSLSPAEELLRAASLAGYELTLEDIDLAASAATDAEVSEALPEPVAEALIGHRRRDNMDLIREQMIGMIFTGVPTPLGFRRELPRRPQYQFRAPPPPPPPRHRQRESFRPPFRQLGQASISRPRKINAPKDVLSSASFPPRHTQHRFPTLAKGVTSFWHGHFPPRPAPPRSPPPPHHHHPPSESNDFPPIDTDFGNTLGPDFGPVTFEQFSSKFEDDFDSEKLSPSIVPSQPIHPPRPKPTRPSFSPFGHAHFGGSRQCTKYTEDICLDSPEYPHEEILSSLIRDPARSDVMIAEVKDQSADDLVDGLSASQEDKYDFSHYFGNRRTGLDKETHRDFALDGGYLCPSEVKYTRPKKARNSKGEWKFIVNVDKYTQTIRMERCMKPGGSCSYVSHHYRATCHQINNYHRLLSWKEETGLHMDIFKVPACCTCHIKGYAYVFPPLNSLSSKQIPDSSDQVIHVVEPDPGTFQNGVEEGFKPANVSENDTKEKESNSSSSFSNRGPGGSGEEAGRFANGETPHPPPPPPPPPTPQRKPGFKRRNFEDEKVNYGYHPIIDFFGAPSN